MSDELQNGEAVTEEVIPAVAEDQNNGVDLATTSEEQHESKAQIVDDAEAKQAAANLANQKVIDKKHFELKQAERDRDQLKSRLDEIERKEQEKLAQSFANNPVMPTIPSDQFADDYDAQVSKYQEDMIAYGNQVQSKATFDANQNVLVQQQQYQQAPQRQQRQAPQQQNRPTNGTQQSVTAPQQQPQTAPNFDDFDDDIPF